jgi:hypothetical protein
MMLPLLKLLWYLSVDVANESMTLYLALEQSCWNGFLMLNAFKFLSFLVIKKAFIIHNRRKREMWKTESVHVLAMLPYGKNK